MGFGDTFSYYEYESDNGHTYNIKLSAITAAQGGFTEADSAFSNPSWPFHERDMRHVTGSTDAGKRAHIPVGINSNALYQNAAGSFTLHGTSYTVDSAIGERRDVRHVK
jgi:hypothetical protein